MELKELYREILNEHNINPEHKTSLPDANITLQGVNPSCGDNITLNLKVDDNGKIADGSFTGSGCAISQASCDMMLDCVIGKTKDEALRLSKNFMLPPQRVSPCREAVRPLPGRAVKSETSSALRACSVP